MGNNIERNGFQLTKNNSSGYDQQDNGPLDLIEVLLGLN